MAIKMYEEEGKKLYEVYINGSDSKGGRYQRRRNGLESLRKAQTVEFEFKRELAQLKSQKVEYRWEEWFDICMSRMKVEVMPSTVGAYKSQVEKWIHPHWRGIEISKITKTEVYDVCFQKCKDIRSEWTRRTIIKMIKRIFQMGVEEGILDRNPCVGIMIRVPESILEVLTPTEVEKLLTEAKSIGHRFYQVWVFAIMTGMRSGEMYALRWNDIDLETRRVLVTKQWTSTNGFCPTKTKKNRVVPISDEFYSFLIELKMERGSEEFVLPRLVEWENGEQAKVLREFCQGIGIRQVRFHDLRATFITNLLANGESLARVMGMVGHSELKTTNSYLRKAGVDLQGGTNKLSFKIPRLDGKVVPLRKA